MRARAGLVLCARVAPQQRQSSRQAPSVAPPTRRAASSVSAPMGRTSAARAASAHALPSLPSSLMHARTAVVLPRARMARSALLAQLATTSPANCTFFLLVGGGIAPLRANAKGNAAPEVKAVLNARCRYLVSRVTAHYHACDVPETRPHSTPPQKKVLLVRGCLK